MPELEDPCEEAKVLRNALRDLAMGQTVARVRWGEDEVAYGKADVASLRQLLASAETRCLAAQGKTRRRYARPVRMRPY